MKKSMWVFIAPFVAMVAIVAGCFPGVTGKWDVRADIRADTRDLAGTPASPTASLPPTTAEGTISSGLTDDDLAKIGKVAIPTSAPTPAPTPTAAATPAPTPTATPPPGERILEGVWLRPRGGESAPSNGKTANGRRLSVKLTGSKKEPLAKSPIVIGGNAREREWFGSGLLFYAGEQEWIGVVYDDINKWFVFFGTQTIVTITEEAFLSE